LGRSTACTSETTRRGESVVPTIDHDQAIARMEANKKKAIARMEANKKKRKKPEWQKY
jgi:hypothetical protein